MAVHVGAIEQQHERAFQKQSRVSVLRVKKGKNKPVRKVYNVGFGFPTPQAAKEGTYIDHKCPFTGDVHIRGRIMKAMIISTRQKRTVVVRRHYLQYIPKYKRYEKRHRNIQVHMSPCFDAKEGDIVTIGECRPLSKTVRFNVLKVEPKEIFGSARKQFCLF